MSDSASVTTSSLAVAEKRPRRTGGCVGIFFQLFDWNRRFTKKKLFKRLLPPDRAKEASKKFGGDEKLPKLRLIADENSGGFPNMNKNGAINTSVGKHGVQTPSLVARLMGLESMPAVQRDKLLKDSSGEFRVGRREKVGDIDDLEKETTRQEFRPQKLQKTGMVDRRSVTRFGAEALQLKNVLSRSRKHHHPKLASPVKSNSHHPKRNSSRLIGAATRILEPGLHARNKSKYAITYPHSARQQLGNEPMKGENRDFLSGHAACKNCGNLLDIAESTSKRDVHASVNPSQMSLNGYDRSSLEQEQENHGRHIKWQVTNQTYFKDNSQRVIDVGVSSHSQAKINCNKVRDPLGDTKDFVALNKSLSGQTRSRVPAKVEDTKFDNGHDNCLSPGQKRQFTHIIRKQGEKSGVICSPNNRPRMIRTGVVSTGKQPDYQGKIARVGSSDGMTFRFNSPMKNRCEVPTKVERRRNQNSSPCKTTSRSKRSTSNESDEKIKPFPLTGDSLGALLEEKLQQLTKQVEHESGINGTPPKRIHANNIFQELICALRMERSIAHNDMARSSQRNHLYHHRNCRYDHNTSFCLQTKLEKAGELIGRRNSDHLSPGSVLEASFSNDSCCSSSLEDSSVRMQPADSVSYSYDESRFQDPETDIFYSGVLSNKENTTHYELVANLFTYISQVLCSIDVVNSRIKGNIIHAHINEVIFNSELLLSNQTPHNSNEVNSFFICDLLLELDTLAEVMLTRFGNFLGSLNSLNARNQLKRFVFDTLIEYLDSKYVQYSKCGFRAWTNLPPFMGFNHMIHEVVEEVRSWMGYVGVTSDDVDMSSCLGKWTDLEIEAYETCARISGDILEMLVDDIVVELQLVSGVKGIHYYGPMIQ